MEARTRRPGVAVTNVCREEERGDTGNCSTLPLARTGSSFYENVIGQLAIFSVVTREPAPAPMGGYSSN